MRRKESYKLQKVTLNLREGDFDYLRFLHGHGAGKVVRELVIRYISTFQRASSTLDSIITEEDLV